MAIIRNPDYLFSEDGVLNSSTLINILKEHDEALPRYDKLADYYDGKHSIITRSLKDPDSPNNKIVVNYAEYISDFASSYFMGNEIKYVGDQIDWIIEAFNKQLIHMVDTELSRDLSRFGIAYELVYMSSDDIPMPKSTNIDPRNAILVVDDTVEYKTLLGIHRYPHRNAANEADGEIIRVYAPSAVFSYTWKAGVLTSKGDEEPNVFGRVPMIEYWNKPNLTGDYESVLSLIDAYNILMSDRLNDKEKFVQALLVVYGVLAGDTSDEKIETVKALKRLGMLEMPLGTEAEYITKSLQESDTEILKDALKSDIHKISKVPDMTDENFASNSSGVAMAYKLLGLEQLTKTKEAYYKMSLRERLALYQAIAAVKSQAVVIDAVEISMTRSLPTNELETANMVMALRDMVSLQTLLSLLPFVQDPEAEIERLNEEKEANVARMRETFGSQDFIGDEDDGEADEE